MQGLLYAYQEVGRLAHSLSGRFPTSAVPESTVWLNTMTNMTYMVFMVTLNEQNVLTNFTHTCSIMLFVASVWYRSRMEINNSELQVGMPQSVRGKETRGNSQKINSEPSSNLRVAAVQIVCL